MRAMHDAGNDRIRLAKVRLGMTRRVRQRHEHLPQTKVPFANVILHDRLLAREAMFVTKTLEDPLRRVPLLAVNRAILFQNAVDDIRERRQLRALRRRPPRVWRRQAGYPQRRPSRFRFRVGLVQTNLTRRRTTMTQDMMTLRALLEKSSEPAIFWRASSPNWKS